MNADFCSHIHAAVIDVGFVPMVEKKEDQERCCTMSEVSRESLRRGAWKPYFGGPILNRQPLSKTDSGDDFGSPRSRDF
ncbi:hypothetical protein Rcae01_00426 [Novipirellula caenicola]|uniref:Uncharacterized protein n=1 Tax=Novipirellula caenicola TaxID=1536901 RepID=A0ABP9VIE9_9BACT